MANTGTTEIAARQIKITRTLNAPRELVFAAWTRPEHLIHWWGPAGFTNTFIETDIRTGGGWRYIMHGPDGTDYPNLMSFTDVTPPERIAYVHGSGEDPDLHAFEGAVTFEDEDGKTRITMTSTFPTAEARDFVVQNVHAIEGGNQTLDKLAAYLKTGAVTSAVELVLTRTIRAPRSLVFEAWTQAEHFERWFAPNGFSITDVMLDVRPGGRLRFCHHSPYGDEPAWVTGEYIVVDPPRHLVHKLSFADASGHAIERPGFAFESTVDVTLEERDGVTDLTVRHSGLSREQGEHEGWTETLDRLGELLEGARNQGG